jgi:hypothetical protein
LIFLLLMEVFLKFILLYYLFFQVLSNKLTFNIRVPGKVLPFLSHTYPLFPLDLINPSGFKILYTCWQIHTHSHIPFYSPSLYCASQVLCLIYMVLF